MKRSFMAVLLICIAAVPAAATAATVPLKDSGSQRQAIMNAELALNVPGLSAAAAASVQNNVQQIETKLNDDDVPALPVPVYGGCDADRSVLSYLEDQVDTADLDEQTLYTYKRNIYDTEVNLKQRGCQL